ncbi:DUF3558 family protein [Rhodococcus sp. NPDC058521]|uniref:DUF3558 family protein n=1 Tax=Rhodococcus sp. NPDC058521 TaxID=3346536 RepID=UPI0036564485
MPLVTTRSNFRGIVAAAAVLSVAALAGCGDSDTTEPDGAAATSAPGGEGVEASPAFEGVDPCSLVPAERAAEAAGDSEISAERSPQDSPDIIGCDWGGFGEGSASLAVMLGGDLGMEYESIGEVDGKNIELMSGTPGNCAVQVQYSNERTLLVSVVPTGEAKASDHPDPNRKWCDQAADLARIADSNLDWD